jgi:hypothetical protein
VRLPRPAGPLGSYLASLSRSLSSQVQDGQAQRAGCLIEWRGEPSVMSEGSLTNPAILTAEGPVARERGADAAAEAVPWYIWSSIAAIVSAKIGGEWDISWHMSIGRDAFLTAPHLMIYLCGVLAGITCGYLILKTTFDPTSRLRASSVHVLGFQAPIGAFIAAWGGIAMITSAPFDNWWHNAYGLDVTVISPPHILLIAGTASVGFGTLVLILGRMNRAHGREHRALNLMFLYIGSVMLPATLLFESSFMELMHNPEFYRAVALAMPIVLVAIAVASRNRWGATWVAMFYTAFYLGAEWVLPRFSAEPKLGPVYQAVTHFIPLGFPLLLIVPALVIDVLRPRVEGRNLWTQSVVLGGAFLVSFACVQWPFADFLVSPHARNWIFGASYFPYQGNYDDAHQPYSFWLTSPGPARFWLGMATALLAAIVSTRVGLAWGKWMKQVRR